MTTDELLRTLRDIPRPSVPPFFARRVSAIATGQKPRRTPIVMWVYWLALAFAISTYFGATTVTVIGVAAGAIAAFGDQILGAVARIAAPLVGRD